MWGTPRSQPPPNTPLKEEVFIYTRSKGGFCEDDFPRITTLERLPCFGKRPLTTSVSFCEDPPANLPFSRLNTLHIHGIRLMPALQAPPRTCSHRVM